MKQLFFIIGLVGVLAVLFFTTSTGPAAAQGIKTYTLDMTKCSGFTCEDAAIRVAQAFLNKF
jgi:hypothetical protein